MLVKTNDILQNKARKGTEMKNGILKTILACLLAMSMMIVPVFAADASNIGIQPCYAHTHDIVLTMGFDKNNVVYCGLAVDLYSTGTGTSGLMKLFNSSGTLLKTWSISDYEEPIGVEHTYQGTYGTTYTVTYGGYVYGNNMTAPDRVDLSVTGTCKD